MKRTLTLNKIKLEESFLKENEDILSSGFAWFWDVIKNGTVKEVPGYKEQWNLYDQEKNCILLYDIKDQYIYLYIRTYDILESIYDLNDNQIMHYVKMIFKHHFNLKVKSIT